MWVLECFATHPDLIECIYQLVLESQLLHKTVNLLFTTTNQSFKLTFLGGFDLLKPIDKQILLDKPTLLLMWSRCSTTNVLQELLCIECEPRTARGRGSLGTIPTILFRNIRN